MDTSKNNQYVRLEISDSPTGRVKFHYRMPGIEEELLVSSRSITEYDVPPFNPVSTHQYVEIGAGVGEFTPWLVSVMPDGPRPIIIDPAPYGILLLELQECKPFLRNEHQIKKADVIEQRLKTILDPLKVRLYQKTLVNAIREHLELWQCADFIVDHAGAIEWGKITERLTDEELTQAYQILAKPGCVVHASSGGYGHREGYSDIIYYEIHRQF
jgi:hypothetical protein